MLFTYVCMLLLCVICYCTCIVNDCLNENVFSNESYTKYKNTTNSLYEINKNTKKKL